MAYVDNNAAPPSYAHTYAQQPSTAQTYSQQPQQWTCTQCTLKNNSNARQCVACNNPNPNYGPVDLRINTANMDYKQAFKAQLQMMQSWCCSYWLYLHIFMIILVAICLWNAYQRYDLYLSQEDSLLLISVLVFGFGIFAGLFGLYGMYHCVPVAFLLLTIYIVIDIIVDVWVMMVYGFMSIWSVFWLVMW
eukprot:297985_1